MKKILNRIQYNSPVVLTFAIVSLAALALNALTRGWANQAFFSVYRSSFANPLTYVRLIGHVLGHSNMEHYMSNMMLFLILGPMIEERYGSKDLLVMIIVTAIVTGLVNIIFFPHVALLGASGIVFLLIVLSSMVGFSQGKIPLTLILVMILYIGQEIYSGIFTRDNISQITHIIGGVCGLIFGFFNYGSANGEKV